MVISSDIKNGINSAWRTAFPDTGVFAWNKFYKIAGPIIVGLELVQLRGRAYYRPYFVIYPLWKINLKECLANPVILSEFTSAKNLQFSIPFEAPNFSLTEVVNQVRKQLLINLEGNLRFCDVKKAVETHLSTPEIIAQGSGKRANLLEFLFYCALYIGDNELVEAILNNILSEKMTWSMDHFEIWYGNFESWFGNLRNENNHRSEFLEVISRNKDNVHISNLPSTDFCR